ncbi:phosphomannomutase CpsG [Thalassotalea maritima]|uniref:phosphomannomutase CpsG n=1 Tax=Thalassotalea maritima TaxID=3242416 RepID=UPI003526FB0F
MDAINPLSCFKAYDIRGKVGAQIDERIAYYIGCAFADEIRCKEIVIGADNRLSSESLKQALIAGFIDSGVDVIDIGLTGTEEVYFATSYFNCDGGIQITASHNPKDYNGMKLVKTHSIPISNDNHLLAIKDKVEDYLLNDKNSTTSKKGHCRSINCKAAYAQKMLSFIDPTKLKPLRIVVNSGNGVAGHAIDEIEAQLQQINYAIDFIKINHQPDGNFPNGIPNPLLPEGRQQTSEAVIEHSADFGIAFDGDFDRCFLFDEQGQFIDGYYLVGLLAKSFLTKANKPEKVIHDPRVYWNTEEVVKASGGIAVKSKTGHAFIKQRMRDENAIYGGEMSAHHYFRDFNYCDSGMITWLLIAELISQKDVPLSSYITKMQHRYPISGEINMTVSDSDAVIKKVKKHYQALAEYIDLTDGLSMSFIDWRFNLRSSNTEPVLRLNVETKKNRKLLAKQVTRLTALIKNNMQ